jgi:hypothetical protein
MGDTISITPRTTTVTLYQGEDYDEFERLRVNVQVAAEQATSRRLADDDPVRVAAQEFDDFVQGPAKGRGVTLTVTAMPRRGEKGFRTLLAEHPPREGDETDARYGFNYQTMADDLVPASLPAAQFGSIADREAFLDTVSDGDWTRLYNAAITVNQGGAPDPLVSLAARLVSSDDPTSDEKSKQPQRLA